MCFQGSCNLKFEKKSLISGLLGSHGFCQFWLLSQIKRPLFRLRSFCRNLSHTGTWSLREKKGPICGLFRSHGFVKLDFKKPLLREGQVFGQKAIHYSERDNFLHKFKDWEQRPNLWPIWFSWMGLSTGLSS